MTDFAWKVYVKDKNNIRRGQVDDYSSLDIVRRFNDVGTWVMEVPEDCPVIDKLITEGNGIIVTRDDQYYFSGPVTKYRLLSDKDGGVYTLTGADENVWLKRRLTSPSPLQNNPYTTTEFDIRSGVASTTLIAFVNFNMGTSAVLPRRKSDLTFATDPLIGSTVQGRGRWQVLLALLQELATSVEIGFKCYQTGTNIQFEVYQPQDRTLSVRFSYDNENVAGFEYELVQTEGNYLYVGGSGDGTARHIFEKPDSASISQIGRVEGEFIDGRDTNVSTELNQSATEWLANNGRRTVLKLTAIDTVNTVYGTDYELGDIVTVQVNGQMIQDIVREVTVNITPDSATVSPTVGTGRLEVTKTMKVVAALRQRVSNLERRK